jgi:hypothetical protein
MEVVLEHHNGTVSIEDRNLKNMQFAGYVYDPAGNKDDLTSFVEHLDQPVSAFGIKTSAEQQAYE